MTHLNKKFISLCLLLTAFLGVSAKIRQQQHMHIVGAGIVGGMEAYFAYVDSVKNNIPLHITMYEQYDVLSKTTICNIVPSYTPDEILSVVPRGPELVKKLQVRFNEPGGIRVDDVARVNNSPVTEEFKKQVQKYSLDEVGHAQRTQDLLALGKMSMNLWQEMYDTGDAEFKQILESCNFNPCREPKHSEKCLHDGYRIDLIYNVSDAHQRALNMKHDYETLGYTHCALLSPAEVVKLDPYLKDFCAAHSVDNTWNHDAVALWRPGGCFDAQQFLPKLYEYLTKHMGTFENEAGQQQPCFEIQFGRKVTSLEFATDEHGKVTIAALIMNDGTRVPVAVSDNCVFCPGEAIGTLKSWGLQEPAYAGFAGVSLLLTIDIPADKIDAYKNFSHCMEVHQEGIVLAWQARFRDNKIFIGVAGTKAFYGDQRPTIDQEFAKNRNLLQLNMVNDVLPEFISLALHRNTKGKTLTYDDLSSLENNNVAKRWSGVRAVVYDGFPTLGAVYKDNCVIINARCTTHLGSGGGSFAPAAVKTSRAVNDNNDEFTNRILRCACSARVA